MAAKSSLSLNPTMALLLQNGKSFSNIDSIANMIPNLHPTTSMALLCISYFGRPSTISSVAVLQSPLNNALPSVLFTCKVISAILRPSISLMNTLPNGLNCEVFRARLPKEISSTNAANGLCLEPLSGLFGEPKSPTMLCLQSPLPMYTFVDPTTLKLLNNFPGLFNPYPAG